MQTKVFTPGPNRTVLVIDGITYYSLYQAAIVSVDKFGRIQLRSGGHITATTQRAMTQVANQFGYAFRVYSKKGQWFVHWPAYSTNPEHDQRFFDGMILDNVPRGE